MDPPSDPSEIVRRGYDTIAERYDAVRHTFDVGDVLEPFARLLRPGGAVLDVGCGAGVPVARRLLDGGFAVTGIDVSTAMLALAARHAPEATLLRRDMRDLGDFADASFDGVVSCYSLFHVPMRAQRSVIFELARVLRPGGALLLSNGRALWEGVEALHGAPMFWSHPDPRITLQSVVEAGLELGFEGTREHGGERHYWVLARRPHRSVGTRS